MDGLSRIPSKVKFREAINLGSLGWLTGLQKNVRSFVTRFLLEDKLSPSVMSLLYVQNGRLSTGYFGKKAKFPKIIPEFS